MTLPVLRAWQAGAFQVLVSQALLDELDKVWQRPRLISRINAGHAMALLEQLNWRGIWVELATIPPRRRDPKDHPVLSTAIDGKAAKLDRIGKQLGDMGLVQYPLSLGRRTCKQAEAEVGSS